MSGKEYIVKAVPSGDQLTLLAPATVPPTELGVGIAGINTPKLGRPGGQVEQPGAWAARERLRKILIGRKVTFEEEFGEEKIHRIFGKVWFDGKNVAELMVKEGLAEVSTRDKDRGATGVDELTELQTAAKAAKLGRWADDAARNVRPAFAGEADKALAAKLTGTTTSGIVEACLSGTRLRVYLLAEKEMVTVAMTGVVFGKSFKDQSRFFTERAVLNKEVKIKFEGIDNPPPPKGGAAQEREGTTLLGSIVQGNQCFQTELISRGLATVLGATIEKTEFRKDLRAAEFAAREKGINCFGERKIVKTLTDTDKEFVATLYNIHNGDTVTVKTAEGTLEKLRLANCRANKASFPRGDSKSDKGKDKDGKDKEVKDSSKFIEYPAFAFEAREFLRQFIGQKVNVVPEYRRPEETSKDNVVFEARFFVTLKVGERNLNKELLEQGLAQWVSGPQGDARQAGEDMRNVSDEAKSKLKGLWKSEAATGDTKKKASQEGSLKVEDVFKPSKEKATGLETKLKRGKMKGVVEAILNPGRFRVLLHGHNIIITIALKEIYTPSLGRKDANGIESESEPGADEAMHFVRDNFFLRNVEVSVDEVDKTGCFFGNVGIAAGKVYEDAAKILVKEGHAKEGRKPRADAPARLYDVNIGRKDPVKGSVVDFQPTSLHIQTEEAKQRLPQIQADLTKLTAKTSADAKNPVKRGQYVVAKFSADKKYYRAMVIKNAKGDLVTVKYIDWGNSETLPRSQIFPCDGEVVKSVEKLPAAATELGLAFLVPPRDGDDLNAAGKALQDYFKGATLSFTELYTNNQGLPQCIVTKDGAANLQETLLKEGRYRLKKWFRKGEGRKDYLKEFSETAKDLQPLWSSEDKARKDHLGIWSMGDVGSDDDAF